MNSHEQYPVGDKAVDAANGVIRPQINFVGLLAPVITGVLPATFWPTTLAASVGWLYQALVNRPGYVQYQIARTGNGTGGKVHPYPLSHVKLGHSLLVLNDMIADAKSAKMNGVK